MNGSSFSTLLFDAVVESLVETFSIISSYTGQTIWTVNDGLQMFLSIHSRSCIFSSILFLFKW